MKAFDGFGGFGDYDAPACSSSLGVREVIAHVAPLVARRSGRGRSGVAQGLGGSRVDISKYPAMHMATGLNPCTS